MIAASLLTFGTAYAAVTQQQIDADATSTGDVLSAGLGPQNQRYSPLSQVNASNVQNLVPVWSFSFGGEKQRGQESQPVVYNGKMFVTASYSRIFALDAKTGKKLWKYEHRLPDGIMPCCDVVNRGAALYDNLVIFVTLDAQLVALDQETGKVVWKEKVDDYAAGYSHDRCTPIVKGMVISGISGGEFGVLGRVEARDAKTGKLVWTPAHGRGQHGLQGRPGERRDRHHQRHLDRRPVQDRWRRTWNNFTYDPETNLIYVGTGQPAPWNSWLRPGDNLYSSSTLAIDPATGKIVWHFQNTPHDGWDFDGVNEFVTFKSEGRPHSRRQGRSQRLLLRERRQDRQARQRVPVREEDHVGEGDRPQDRQARLRGRQPPG